MPFVLNVGLDPDVVGDPGTPQSASPHVDRKTVEAGLEAARTELAELGLELDSCFIDTGMNGASTVREALGRRQYDVVMIGAGVRLEPSLTELFETLVNTVLTSSPQSRICFNTSPDTTAAAVKRWWPTPGHDGTRNGR